MTTNVTVDKLLVLIQVKMGSGSQKAIDDLNKRMTTLEKNTQKAMSGFQKFDKFMMSFGLSTLFTGMALKMLATNILTGLVTAFVTARDEGDFFVNKLLSLQAGFEFLKFAIFDAFANSDWFVPMIDKIVNMTNAVSTFISKNPGWAKFFVIASAGAVIIGGLMMVLGQAGLASLGVSAIMQAGLIPALLKIALILAPIIGLFLLWNSELDPISKLLGTITIAMGIMFGIAVKLGIVLAAPFMLAGIAIAVLVSGILLLMKRFGSFKDAMKAMGIGLLFMLGLIGDGIITLVLAPLNSLIVTLNHIIAMSNKLLGTNIGMIATVSTTPITGAVDKLKANFEAEQRAEGDGTIGQGSGSSVTNVFNIDNAFGDDAKLMAGMEEAMRKMGIENIGSPNGG